MLSMQNPSLAIHIDPENGWFSVIPHEDRFPRLEQVRLGCEYILDRDHVHSLDGNWGAVRIEHEVIDSLQHGRVELQRLALPPDRNGIGFNLSFGITREYPLIMWKVEIVNRSNTPVSIRQIDLVKIDGSRDGSVKYPAAVRNADLGFFSNGWQSWSPTRWYRGDQKMQISRLGAFQHPMIYNPGTPLPRQAGAFSSDMFAVIGDMIARTGFLIGFLSQKNHFGSIYADLNRQQVRMWANGDDARLDTGCSIETDWAVFTPLLLDHRDPLEVYLEAAARENHARARLSTPVGWCSWYHFYTKVTARDIENNLSAITAAQENLPVELVQIDDGFETQVGDWFSFKPTFPQGLIPISEKIKRQGLMPGLWLAPFIVHPSSELVRDHPDWLLRNAKGRAVNAGFVWNRLDTALDLTIPDALDYACRVVDTAVHEWGFPYLKLDFLYAAALKGRYQDATKTRAQVMRLGMEALRRAAGDGTILLGCGAPLGSMLGLVDVMRIGPDVSGEWAPAFNGISAFFNNEPSMPSARNSIRNIITRANLDHKWWVNDPDCLLLRPDTHLALAEVRSLATAIAMTGGSLLLSDDLPKLPPERLRIGEVLIPVINEPVKIIDWFDAEIPARLRLDLVETGGWSVLAGFNWSDQPVDLCIDPADYRLESGHYYFREFWSGQVGQIGEDEPIQFRSVPAHGCVVLALRRKETGKPVYIGSDLHFTQGIELVEWQDTVDEISLTLRLPRSTAGKIFLYLPRGAGEAKVNGSPEELVLISDDIYSLNVQVDGFCSIRINY